LKRKKNNNYNKIELVDNNGDNIYGSKIWLEDLVTIKNIVRYHRTFIDKKMSHEISLQLFGVKLLMREVNMQEEDISQHGVFWSKWTISFNYFAFLW
jgi:hypothetical protein